MHTIDRCRQNILSLHSFMVCAIVVLIIGYDFEACGCCVCLPTVLFTMVTVMDTSFSNERLVAVLWPIELQRQTRIDSRELDSQSIVVVSIHALSSCCMNVVFVALCVPGTLF